MNCQPLVSNPAAAVRRLSGRRDLPKGKAAQQRLKLVGLFGTFSKLQGQRPSAPPDPRRKCRHLLRRRLRDHSTCYHMGSVWAGCRSNFPGRIQGSHRRADLDFCFWGIIYLHLELGLHPHLHPNVILILISILEFRWVCLCMKV